MPEPPPKRGYLVRASLSPGILLAEKEAIPSGSSRAVDVHTPGSANILSALLGKCHEAPGGGANQLLKRGGRMRLRCMSGFEIGPEAPGSTTSPAWLNPGYGFGAPATIGRNRDAGNRGHRKCLAAKWMREQLCPNATTD